MVPPHRRTILVLAAALLVGACGGGDDAAESSATPAERIDACLTQQPDASRGECEEWEEAGELRDDGTHEDHESMGG